MKTQLYRHYDSDNTLLYVGISYDVFKRTRQHAKHSNWHKEISRIDVEAFDTRDEALDAETVAIQSELPKYNIQKTATKSKTNYEKWVEECEYLVHRMVNIEPMYTLCDAGVVLCSSESTVRKLIKAKKLSCINNSPTRKTNSIRITGWQMIDFLDYLQEGGSIYD